MVIRNKAVLYITRLIKYQFKQCNILHYDLTPNVLQEMRN